MNILHMKYAVEVANAGSINKASETLLIAQPNLSRSIKELESDLGIAIFDRSAKGMVLTEEGERFIGHAKKILAQIDEVETMYKTGAVTKQQFSVCVPRASYIAEAFAHFSKGIEKKPILKDVDGTQIQIYNTQDGKIKVVNDYEVDAVYVDSDVKLEEVI